MLAGLLDWVALVTVYVRCGLTPGVRVNTLCWTGALLVYLLDPVNIGGLEPAGGTRVLLATGVCDLRDDKHLGLGLFLQFGLYCCRVAV